MIIESVMEYIRSKDVYVTYYPKMSKYPFVYDYLYIDSRIARFVYLEKVVCKHPIEVVIELSDPEFFVKLDRVILEVI